MNIDPFNLFYEEFKYKLKKHNIACPHLETQQLARKEWEQMSEIEQFRFVYIAKRQDEAYLNFKNKSEINQENPNQHNKMSKQDYKSLKHQFQINYCKNENCENQAVQIEEELLKMYQDITINRYAIMGKFGAVSLFGIQEKRQSVLIWHTLIDGPIKKYQLKELHQKVQRFLTP
ncbi:unnamed protein product (macronuclear) [Paramecium tetraurelia]|uniref:HMG box domain-containing protein n=1 Tax=Paramecium tetraurelia TaxID=5888 RepID=A0BCF2_PARTE|nr:uncharacterized protein GSPATT00004313001 [Paramecium tetraurelia]CAK56219.1 unnamed protein product [Paramecium tetraurelia]|eukprot:XP_001423617.1 hypothetical protein (macronuclear) [Paramecium tetraurelia strain d4-2]